MLKLRLKKKGRKKLPSYRIVVMENTTRRDGRPIDDVGYYNTTTKLLQINNEKIQKWLNLGVIPTETVYNLLKKSKILE